MTPAEIAKRVERVRRICLAYPDANERTSHGMPTFFIRDKVSFLTFAANHRGDGRIAFWCAAPPGAQEALVAAEPERFFRPQYVGHRGWLGVRMERPDWKLVASIVDDAYRAVAPRKLLATLSDASATGTS